MNHPDRGDLTAYLYEELAPAQTAEVKDHLAACPECRAQVESWRGVRRDLAAWKIPAGSGQDLARAWGTGRGLNMLCRWAALGAAASILVFAGFGPARLSGPQPVDAVALRETVARQLRAEWRAELAGLAADQTRRQEKSEEALARTLEQFEAQRVVDYARLHREIEIMAVHTENAFLDTRENLSRLAGTDSLQSVLPNP